MLDPIIIIQGAGDIASGVALRLYQAGLRRIVLIECAKPLAVRRHASFSEAVYEGSMRLEGITAALIQQPQQAFDIWSESCIPLLVDPNMQSCLTLRPHVLIEATLRKHTSNIHVHDAPLTIGLGPGFCAGHNVHRIIETQRGGTLGRVIRQGTALPNTGIPHAVEGYALERVIRTKTQGIFLTLLDIGSLVRKGDLIGTIQTSYQRRQKPIAEIFAAMDGKIRGLLRSGLHVSEGCKIGDIDPDIHVPCYMVSDKALAVAGGTLEAIMEYYNTKPRLKNGVLQGV